MSRIRDPMRDKSFEMWKNNKDITNREIAKTLGIDEKKVATWKNRDNWSKEKKECSTTNKEVKNKCSTTKKKSRVSEKEIEKITDDNLTEKQRLFCIYYIQSFNGTQSAIKAGYAVSGAFVEANRLLKIAKVKTFLNELKQLYLVDDYMEGKMLIQRHQKIAFSDMNDFVDSNGSLKELSSTDGTLIKKVTCKITESEYGSTTSTTMELEDRSKSLDYLGKFYGIDPRFNLDKEKLELEKEKANPKDDEDDNDTSIKVELV